MAHDYNRAAFRAAISSTGLLPATYMGLVEIELALKDTDAAASGNWPRGHDLPLLIASLGEASTAELLRTELAKLWCTDIRGGRASVDAAKYPDLRYLQHVNDFTDGSSDVDLAAAVTCLESVRLVLRRHGIGI